MTILNKLSFKTSKLQKNLPFELRVGCYLIQEIVDGGFLPDDSPLFSYCHNLLHHLKNYYFCTTEFLLKSVALLKNSGNSKNNSHQTLQEMKVNPVGPHSNINNNNNNNNTKYNTNYNSEYKKDIIEKEKDLNFEIERKLNYQEFNQKLDFYNKDQVDSYESSSTKSFERQHEEFRKKVQLQVGEMTIQYNQLFNPNNQLEINDISAINFNSNDDTRYYENNNKVKDNDIHQSRDKLNKIDTKEKDKENNNNNKYINFKHEDASIQINKVVDKIKFYDHLKQIKTCISTSEYKAYIHSVEKDHKHTSQLLLHKNKQLDSLEDKIISHLQDFSEYIVHSILSCLIQIESKPKNSQLSKSISNYENHSHSGSIEKNHHNRIQDRESDILNKDKSFDFDNVNFEINNDKEIDYENGNGNDKNKAKTPIKVKKAKLDPKNTPNPKHLKKKNSMQQLNNLVNLTQLPEPREMPAKSPNKLQRVHSGLSVIQPKKEKAKENSNLKRNLSENRLLKKKVNIFEVKKERDESKFKEEEYIPYEDEDLLNNGYNVNMTLKERIKYFKEHKE